MSTITMKQMLESGIHFGHQTRRWNPKMARYIYGERHGVYIIDLQKTLRQLHRTYVTVRDTVAQGGSVLFVGTKKQARDPVQHEAERCGMFYVNSRWLGGTLTNWSTIQNSINKLVYLEELETSGKIEAFTKKEAILFRKKREKLERNLNGIKKMEGPPQIMFVVDVHREDIAVKEANRLSIKCIGICDTNSDPDTVDIAIPGNDDAIRAIEMYCQIVADAVMEGRLQYDKELEEEESERAAEAKVAVQSAKLVRQQSRIEDGEEGFGEADAEAPSAEAAEEPAAVEAAAEAPATES